MAVDDVGLPETARGLARISPRRWRLWSLSRPVLGYVLAVEAAALAAVIASLQLVPIARQHWIWFALLVVGTVVHLEAARGIERIREVSAEGVPHAQLQDVWLFAGVLLLPPPLLAALVLVSYVHAWVRVYRRRALLYRKTFSAATVVLGCAAAVAVLTAAYPGRSEPFATVLDGPVGLIAVSSAGVLYWLVNYALVVGVLLATNPGRPGRAALGDASEQLIVVAGIGLATGVSVVLTTRPWWTPLLIVTVLALHMGLLLPQFRAASRTDAKTGLFDPAFWAQVTTDELGRTQRLGGTLGVLILDLDHFKQVNDRHGHLAGDTVLRAVADAIRHSVRRHDLVGRYGGEEFAVVLPGLDGADVHATAERIRLAIAELTVEVRDRAGAPRKVSGLTASIGAAVFPEHGTDRTTLLRAADAALYEAKAAGRDRTKICPVAGAATLTVLHPRTPPDDAGDGPWPSSDRISGARS